jgi:hypothetical protein
VASAYAHELCEVIEDGGWEVKAIRKTRWLDCDARGGGAARSLRPTAERSPGLHPSCPEISVGS